MFYRCSVPDKKEQLRQSLEEGYSAHFPSQVANMNYDSCMIRAWIQLLQTVYCLLHAVLYFTSCRHAMSNSQGFFDSYIYYSVI